MKENIHVFDFQRIFFGNYSWTFALEIVFRTTLLYLYAMLLLRLLGKRGTGQLSAFEFVIIFALGAAVGDPMLYADVPVLHGMVVITVIVFLQRGLVRLSERNAKFEAFVESRTRRVVLNGSLDLEAMHGESLAREELFSALREAGVEQLGQVKRAYLEPSGRVSVFRLPANEVGPGLSLMPPTDEDYQNPVPTGSPTPLEGQHACWSCGRPRRFGRGTALPRCPHCRGEEGWVAASESLTA